MASSQSSQSTEGARRQEEEGPRPLQDSDFFEILQDVPRRNKVRKLVPFLFHKCQKKEQITVEEMMHIVDDDFFQQSPQIFRQLCESVCRVFGMEMREVDPPGHTYELLPVLGLTYSGMLDDDDQIIPKVDLLVDILTVIFINGNRVREEALRNHVRKWEMLARRKQFDFGEPWQFITGDLVREEYLEYRQVPNSDPARYEFLWGPRAQAETTKMKLLELGAKRHMTDPRSFPTYLYEEALREEQGVFSFI